MSIISSVMNFPRQIAQMGFKLMLPKSAVALWPMWLDGQPAYADPTYENYIRQGLKKNEVIYACIMATSGTGAMVSVKAQDRRDDKEIVDHPLRVLMRNPNAIMSEFGFFSWTIINLKVAGRAYWQKVRNEKGQVIQLWPLRPDWLTPVRSNRALIERYDYGPGESDVAKLALEDVLCFMHRDPMDILQSLSPVGVAARVGQIDNSTTDFLKLFWERGASVTGVLSSKLKLNDAAVGDIMRRWEARYGGFQNWLKPAVLDSDATYQRIGMTFKEMEFDSLDTRNELRICAVLQVPPILVGVKAGLDRATYSNYEQARRAWWQDTLTPLYKMIADDLNTQLAPEFGSDIYAAFDFSKVPAMQEDRTARWQRATMAYEKGAITRNEAREEMGLARLDGVLGEQFVQWMAQASSPSVAQPAPAPDPEENVKSLPKQEGKATGKPLDDADAVKVDPFEQAEIDKMLALYNTLKDSANA